MIEDGQVKYFADRFFGGHDDLVLWGDGAWFCREFVARREFVFPDL